MESLVNPPRLYELDLITGDCKLLDQEQVHPLASFSPSKYNTWIEYAKSRDGTQLPIWMTGPSPMLLLGYGSYGVTWEPWFLRNIVPLLDRGFVCAIAQIRGSGTYGYDWYRAGALLSKNKTFTDFIDVAEHFIQSGMTTSSRLAIQGASAGGLLIGAVLNLKPSLFGAAIAHVPFVDVLNTMLDSSIPLTTAEYIEWGNPNTREEFENMLSYSPYENLHKGKYPPVLLTSSWDDSRVMYWEPMKWIAKYRQLHEAPDDSGTAMLRTSFDSGHGGAMGRFQSALDTASELAFLIDSVGKPLPEP